MSDDMRQQLTIASAKIGLDASSLVRKLIQEWMDRRAEEVKKEGRDLGDAGDAVTEPGAKP